MEILSRYFPSFALDIVRLCVWLVILMIIFVPLEKLCAVYPRKVFRRAFGTDVAYYFLSGLLPRLLLVLPMNLVAGIIHRAQPLGLYSWVADLPLWIRLVAAFVVGEAGSYWGHRWSHEIPLLWRFHAIHHSAEEIDWLVNTRAHPVDMVFTRMCGLIPMYLLGLAQPRANTVDLVPVLVTIAGTIWGFFLHANVSWRFGWLRVAGFFAGLPPLASHQRWSRSDQQEFCRDAALAGQVFRHLLPSRERMADALWN